MNQKNHLFGIIFTFSLSAVLFLLSLFNLFILYDRRDDQYAEDVIGTLPLYALGFLLAPVLIVMLIWAIIKKSTFTPSLYRWWLIATSAALLSFASAILFGLIWDEYRS